MCAGNVSKGHVNGYLSGRNGKTGYKSLNLQAYGAQAHVSRSLNANVII